MKTATVSVLKNELDTATHEELIVLCVRLAKFKKENKELLTYLLYHTTNEDGYIAEVQQEIKNAFAAMNTTSVYYIKKSTRKILRDTKKYIRYSGKKETEVALLLYFCKELKEIHPSVLQNRTLQNLFQRQLAMIQKAMSTLHEDLQYDYQQLLDALY